MNRVFIILIYILYSTFILKSEESNIKYNLSFSMEDIEIDTLTISEKIFTSIKIFGFDSNVENNEPILPVKFVTIKVPTQCNNIRAEVRTHGPSKSIQVHHPIIPGMNAPTKIIDQQSNSNELIGVGYRAEPNNKPYVKICDECFINGYEHIVTLGIYPVLYNHENKELLVFTDVNIELDYDLCNTSEMNFTPINNFIPYRLTTLPQIVENGNAFDVKRIGNYVSGDSIIKLKNYVIIVPENLKNGVDRLAKWKEEKGYKVKIQVIEDILKDPQFIIGSNIRCFDKESSVREWMKFYMSQIKELYFCLIIGDYRTSAPIRKFRTNDELTDPNSLDYSPTDAYFSDLVSEWSLSKDPSGLYSCNMLTSSFSPTIPVGRLLCSSCEEIERYTEKLILYELYPGRGDTDYLNKGLLVQHHDAFSKNISLFDNLPNMNVEIFKDNQSSKISELKPLGNDIISSMNKCGILSWQGHGEPISISIAEVSDDKNNWPWNRFIMAQTHYNSFHSRYSADINNGLDLIGNENYPSVAYSLACEIAPFDDVSHKHNWNDNLCEYHMGSAFTVAGTYGGPALLANTRDGYWISSSDMEKEFGKHLMQNSCIGVAEMNSKITVPNQNSSSVKKVKFRHNLIGDPEFNVWISKPQELEGTAKYFSNSIMLFCENFDNGCFALSCKDIRSQISYTGTKRLYFTFSNIFENSEIATLYLWQDNFLPLTQILTSGKEIKNESRQIFVKDAYFSKITDEVYIFDRIPAYINIGSNSNINIYSLKNITSDSGIIIKNDGILTLKSTEVSLKGDIIKNGANLRVSATNIILDAGVVIEKGACAEFTTF